MQITVCRYLDKCCLKKVIFSIGYVISLEIHVIARCLCNLLA